MKPDEVKSSEVVPDYLVGGYAGSMAPFEALAKKALTSEKGPLIDEHRSARSQNCEFDSRATWLIDSHSFVKPTRTVSAAHMNPGLYTPQGSSMPPTIGAVNVGRMLALPGFKPGHPQAASPMPGGVDQIIDSVLGTLDAFVVRAIEARTAAEFRTTLARVLPEYIEAVLGLSHIVRVLVLRDVLEVISDESFTRIEESFRESGLAAFGQEVREQAIFTAWTLRKINSLCKQVDRVPLDSDLTESDRRLFNDFLFHAMYARFSLDCLSKSMTLRKPIYPDVLLAIIDGMRNAVNSYAYVRRALDLRDPLPALADTHVEWDDEDRQLLDEANHDIVEVGA